MLPVLSNTATSFTFHGFAIQSSVCMRKNVKEIVRCKEINEPGKKKKLCLAYKCKSY